MKTLILTIIFVLTLALSALLFTPLGFVLSRIGLGSAGIGWAQAEGTLRKGRVDGLFLPGQFVGDVSLELRPLSILYGGLAYDVQWGGASGRGTGVLELRPSRIKGREMRAQLQISAIEGLAPIVRAAGGDVRLQAGSFELSRTGCEAAGGRLTSDVLSRAAQSYGREFGPVEGRLSCENGQFVLDAEGQSQSGDELELDARASLFGAAQVDVKVRTDDDELPLVLSSAQFQLRDGVWSYSYASGGMVR
ncbi:MAG: type II secretion system protein N [Henriciella sp.]|nr:type II secretion system protein N [Henriciella sp.]